MTTGDGGSEAAVADSNRLEIRGASSGLTIVNVADLLAERPSVSGKLRAGAFPRDVSVTPNGQTLLVSHFNSSQIQVVKLAGL